MNRLIIGSKMPSILIDSHFHASNISFNISLAYIYIYIYDFTKHSKVPMSYDHPT